MRKKAALHNLGCKVNAYETEAMRQLLEEAGYEIVPFEPGADVYVINTCTVTNIADRKSRQMLHRARKIESGCGCRGDRLLRGDRRTAQPRRIRRLTSCSAIIERENCSPLLGGYEEHRREKEYKEAFTDKIDINHTKEYENLQISRSEARTRADIKVQDGCNQFCTYCIIPFARGRVRSRDIRTTVLKKRACSPGAAVRRWC